MPQYAQPSSGTSPFYQAYLEQELARKGKGAESKARQQQITGSLLGAIPFVGGLASGVYGAAKPPVSTSQPQTGPPAKSPVSTAPPQPSAITPIPQVGAPPTALSRPPPTSAISRDLYLRAILGY